MGPPSPAHSPFATAYEKRVESLYLPHSVVPFAVSEWALRGGGVHRKSYSNIPSIRDLEKTEKTYCLGMTRFAVLKTF